MQFSKEWRKGSACPQVQAYAGDGNPCERRHGGGRSEEHTSELQSQSNLVCRLLLEKKNNTRMGYLPDPTTIQHSRYSRATAGEADNTLNHSRRSPSRSYLLAQTHPQQRRHGRPRS